MHAGAVRSIDVMPVGEPSLAVLFETLMQPHPTVPSIADALGRSKATVHAHLVRLRRCGLVEWCDGSRGTLRPLVRVVPFGEAVR